MKELQNTNEKQCVEKKNEVSFVLMLYNDDINTFEYVIKCLIDICKHDICQAEQCAYLAHFTGKIDILHGNENYLQSLCSVLSKKGLSVKVEKL